MTTAQPQAIRFGREAVGDVWTAGEQSAARTNVLPTSCRKAVIASGALISLAFLRAVGHTGCYDGPISETFTARSDGYYGLD